CSRPAAQAPVGPDAVRGSASALAKDAPPATPGTAMHDLSYREMARMMEMDDAAAFGKLLADQFEWRHGDGADGPDWDIQGWYGTDYNKLWLKTEGVRLGSVTEDGRAELL